jgi:hypothetical protein
MSTYDEDKQLLGRKVVGTLGGQKTVMEAWGGDARPDEFTPVGQLHTCSWKGCNAAIPFPGFCPDHLQKVKTSPIAPEDLKKSVARPSAKNVAMIGEGHTADDFLTAEARENARLARVLGQPGFEEPPPPREPVFKAVAAPVLGPDGRPVSSVVELSMTATSVPEMTRPSPSVPVPAPSVPSPQRSISPAVVTGGSELKTAMSVYAALAALPDNARQRVLSQVLDMFDLRTVPTK